MNMSAPFFLLNNAAAARLHTAASRVAAQVRAPQDAAEPRNPEDLTDSRVHSLTPVPEQSHTLSR